MVDEPRLENDVRTYRVRLGWSQDELARQSGLSRAGISAIETGRLVPSTGAALALARAFGCTVEDLFRLPRVEASLGGDTSDWAWPAPQPSCRYWRAEVDGKTRAYPVEVSPLGLLPHDGLFQDGTFHEHARVTPEQTLVLACCDPAVGLIAQETGANGRCPTDRAATVQPRGTGIAPDMGWSTPRGSTWPERMSPRAIETWSGSSFVPIRIIACCGSPTGMRESLSHPDWASERSRRLFVPDSTGYAGKRVRARSSVWTKCWAQTRSRRLPSKSEFRLRPPWGGRCDPERLGRRGHLPASDQRGSQSRFPQRPARGLRPLFPHRTGKRPENSGTDPSRPIQGLPPVGGGTARLRCDPDRRNAANRPKRQGQETLTIVCFCRLKSSRLYASDSDA